MKLILLGGGGHALVVAETARMLGHTVAGFLDDNPDAPLARFDAGGLEPTHLGPLSEIARLPELVAGRAWVLATGHLPLRRRAIEALPPCRTPALVHPRAYVSHSAQLGRGVWVGPHGVVHTLARIGDHAIVNTTSVIEHECPVGENAHAAPGSVLAGRASLGADALLGVGARTLPGIRIGRSATVGAGACVIRDVDEGRTVAGVPARALQMV